MHHTSVIKITMSMMYCTCNPGTNCMQMDLYCMSTLSCRLQHKLKARFCAGTSTVTVFTTRSDQSPTTIDQRPSHRGALSISSQGSAKSTWLLYPAVIDSDAHLHGSLGPVRAHTQYRKPLMTEVFDMPSADCRCLFIEDLRHS